MEKKELIAKLQEMGATISEKELKKKTNKELEEMLSVYSTFSSLDDEYQVEFANEPTFNLEELKEQIRKEALEQARKELLAEKEAFQEIKMDAPVAKPEIDRNMVVPVMNVTNGILVYQSRKTGIELKWEKYGDIEYMDVAELLTMRSSQRRFLDEPFILVMNNEAVDYLGLKKMYDKMIHPDNIDAVFKLSNERFEEVLETAPRGIAYLIIGRAKDKVADGTLDSIAKLKILEEKFNVHLQE